MIVLARQPDLTARVSADRPNLLIGQDGAAVRFASSNTLSPAALAHVGHILRMRAEL
jgi:hypothetical protein